MADKLHGTAKSGVTSLSLPVLLTNSSTFLEVTGKLAADVTASYVRQGGVRTAIALSDLATVGAAYAAGGWKEIDAVNMPGLYRLDVPDAVCAAAGGAEWVTIAVKVAGSLTFYERVNLETAGSAEVYARLGPPGGASVSFDIGAVKTDTAAIKLKTDAFPASVGDATLANQTTILANLATKAAAGDAMTLTSGERDSVAAALLDLAAGVETGATVREVLRLIGAIAGGKISGAAGTTVTIRDLGDTRDRVVATVDPDGNRNSLVLDLT